jgi:hypothetical protein
VTDVGVGALGFQDGFYGSVAEDDAGGEEAVDDCCEDLDCEARDVRMRLV